MTFGQQAGRGPVRGGPAGLPGPGAPAHGPMPATQGPPPGYAGHGRQAHGRLPAHGSGGHQPVPGGLPHGGTPSPYGPPARSEAPSPYGPPARGGAQVPYGPPFQGAPSPGSWAPHGVPPHPYDAPPRYGSPVPGQVPPAGRRRREPGPVSGPVSDEDERWAVPAYVGMFVGGLIAPAIVYLAKGRSSPFARFHAVQALNLCVAMTVADLAAYGLLYVIGFPGLFIALAVVAAECFCVVRAAIGANRREWYRLPSLVAWPILR